MICLPVCKVKQNERKIYVQIKYPQPLKVMEKY